MRDGSHPRVGGKHRTAVRLSFHGAQCATGIHADEQVLEHIPLVVDTACIALQTRTQQDTLLTLITAADAVARHLVTTHGRELVFLTESGPQRSILPVVGRFGLIQAIAHLTILIQFVPDIGPLPRIEEIQFLGDLAPAERGTVIDIILAVRAFLGGDDDHTVGTSGTVNSSSRYILQHLDALDIRGIQECQRIE